MYCGKCGTSNPESNNFCMKCGSELAPSTRGPQSPQSQEADTRMFFPPTMSVGLYASFWRRIAAYLIDYFVIGTATAFLAVGVVSTRSESDGANAIVLLLIFAAPWLYATLFESSGKQATLGKLALGIKVTDLNGNRISFVHATGRFFAEILSTLTLGFGYAIAAFTNRRQALHDIVASTLVVRKPFPPEQILGAPPAKPWPVWAIVLILLFSPLPIIGTLAAIAIPAYQDYTIRSQISEGLAIASDVKAGVAAFHAQTGFWPADNYESGLGSTAATAQVSGRYFDSIDVSDGTIYITYGGDANERIQGTTLSIRPLVSESGDVLWLCGNANPPQNAYYNSAGAAGDGTDSGQGMTDLEDKWLPAACRTGFGGA